MSDAAVVFRPFAEVQAYFGRQNDVDDINFYADDPGRVDDAFRKLITHTAQRPIHPIDWQRFGSGR